MVDLIFKDRKEINNKFRSHLFSDEEKKKITRRVFEYALNNKKRLNKTYANPKLSDDELFTKCEQSICKELNMVLYPTQPTTKPDTLTSILLERLYEHDINSRESIAKQYLEQKRTEIDPRLFFRSFVIEPLTSDIIQFEIAGYFFCNCFRVFSHSSIG